jgi:hypothetical protein
MLYTAIATPTIAFDRPSCSFPNSGAAAITIPEAM